MSDAFFNTEMFIGRMVSCGEIISAPVWVDPPGEWRALVAVTHRGPLLLVSAKITSAPVVDGREP